MFSCLPQPACLPITTHYLPPQTELSSRNLYTLKSIEVSTAACAVSKPIGSDIDSLQYPMAEFDESSFIRPSPDGMVDKRAVVKEMAMQRRALFRSLVLLDRSLANDAPLPQTRPRLSGHRCRGGHACARAS